MCHEYSARIWNSEAREVEGDEGADESPEFLTDDEVGDAEILTDGGDES